MKLRNKWISKHSSSLLLSEGNPKRRDSVVELSFDTVKNRAIPRYNIFNRTDALIPATQKYQWSFVGGVVRVYYTDDSSKTNVCPVPSFQEFVDDFNSVSSLCFTPNY